jgi:hypothetical protein
MPEVERVSVPYWEWEDHRAGLYRIIPAAGEDERARELLADPERLLDAMRQAVESWPTSALHQLSNTEQNRRAWLGWAACKVAANSCARATRYAWPRLTNEQRAAANAAADTVITEWERAHAIESAGYQPSLFDFDGGVSGA